jgi:SNF2 family DNA or RNA helicase
LKGVGVAIQAGGVGLNGLQRAWKGLFVDLAWTHTANEQAEGRLIRIGQESNKVEFIRMVSDHPLDLHVVNLLIEKIETCHLTLDKKIEAKVPEKVHFTQMQGQPQVPGFQPPKQLKPLEGEIPF